MKEFFITDFDGTINFGSDFDITMQIINEITSKYELIIATGRNYEDFFSYFPEDLKNYSKCMIFSNGAVVISKGNINYYSLEETTIKYMLNNNLIRGVLLFEKFNGEQCEREYLTNDEVSEIIRVQVITESEVDYVWNLNVFQNLGFNFLTSRLNNISVYPFGVNKLTSGTKNVENGILKKVMGNDFNDISMFVGEDIEYLYVTQNMKVEEILKFIRR